MLLGGNLSNMDMSSLRFFLSGERNIAHTIYYTMLKKVKEIRVAVRNIKNEDEVTTIIGPEKITPVGFTEDEGLLPYPANTFPGYRIVQEYFCFPEKFLFVDVGGLEQGFNRRALNGLAEAKAFSLQFVLDEMPDGYESFRKENWQLFCTPVVNLFPMDASPLTFTHKQTEYRIVPDPRRPYHFNTYSVNKVHTWQRKKGGDIFTPFESFEHDADKTDPKPFFRLRLKPSLNDDGTETYISIVLPPKATPFPENHVISLELTCSNRLLATQLALGEIHTPATDTASNVTFKNILPVSPPYNPPLEGDLLWRLLSNMSLNYISLTNIEALKAVLTTYDFRALHDRQRARQLARQLQGMRHIECEETDRIYKGLPLRGARTTLTLDQRYYACEGDMFLFGSVLNEFLALYATVNSFHQFSIVEDKRREKYTWVPRLGEVTTG
jgi:type VI secretion system protein ImpG